MKHRLAVLVVLTFSTMIFAADKPKQDSWTGLVSDAQCGASVDSACVKRCVASGQPMVLVTDADQNVIAIANQEKLKGMEGAHVTLLGSLKDNAITISEVKPLGK